MALSYIKAYTGNSEFSQVWLTMMLQLGWMKDLFDLMFEKQPVVIQYCLLKWLLNSFPKIA